MIDDRIVKLGIDVIYKEMVDSGEWSDELEQSLKVMGLSTQVNVLEQELLEDLSSGVNVCLDFNAVHTGVWVGLKISEYIQRLQIQVLEEWKDSNETTAEGEIHFGPYTSPRAVVMPTKVECLYALAYRR